MEPVAVPSASGPGSALAISLRSDLTSTLERGRVLAGEVLEKLDGGTVVLGLDGRRVNAESHVELEKGQQFLARVEVEAGKLVLRLLDPAATDSALLRALRALLPSEPPGPEWWRGVVTTLAQAQPGKAAVSPSISEAAAPGAPLQDAPPSIAPSDLRAWIVRSGLFHEASVASLAHGAPRPLAQGEVIAALAERLGTALETVLAAPASPRLSALTAERVREFLRAFLADPEHAGRGTEDLGRELMRWVAAQGRAWRSPSLVALSGFVQWLREVGGEWLGVFTDEIEPAVRARLTLETRVSELRGDLKSVLTLLSLDERKEPLAVNARQALEGLTREQLLNVARAGTHEALHAWVPLPTDACPGGLHLWVHPEREADAGAGRKARRWTLDVDFTRLGPIHAELLLEEGALHLRLDTRDETTAEALRAHAGDLARDLAREGEGVTRRVAVIVARAAVPEQDPGSTRYLEEHPLLDVTG